MTADTTQPAGALPLPAIIDRDGFGGETPYYDSDTMRAMMAERDAARGEATALRRSRDAAVRAMDAIAEQKSFFMRELDAMKLRAADVEGERAANALLTAEVDALRRELEELRAIPPDAREGREPLTLPEIKALSNAVDVAWSAGRHEGNWDEMFARAIEAALGISPAGTSADGER